MFSSIFGKRRSSPVENNEAAPIPSASNRPEDGYVFIEPAPTPRAGLYPNVSGTGALPLRPAPALPGAQRANIADQNFHYLQGVPFSLSRELQMASNKDSFAIEVGHVLAFVTNKINLNNYNYDFAVEKSVLKEC